MDLLSHGLWAILLVKTFFKRSKLWLVFLFGMLPDLISLGVPFLQVLFSKGLPPIDDNFVNFYPSYSQVLYSITHSLIIVVIVFLSIYLINKKIYVWMLGWPLHILMDIPTHSKGLYETSIFYPVSNFSINGFNWWTHPYIFIINWTLLIIFFVIIYRKELYKRFSKKTKKKQAI